MHSMMGRIMYAYTVTGVFAAGVPSNMLVPYATPWVKS